MNEGNYREYGGGISCYFHPKEVVVGVCHLCLNERLLIIAAKQGANSKPSKIFGSKYKHNNNSTSSTNSSYDDIPLKYHHHHTSSNKPKSYISFPKFFGIGSLLFNAKHIIRHHHRRSRKSNHDSFDIVVDDHDHDADTTSTSVEDESFISIKFGDNGLASWDKTSTKVSKEPIEHSSLSWCGQSAVKDATLKGSGGNHSHTSVVEHEHPKPRPSLRWRKRIGQLLQVIKCKKSCSKANAGGGSSSGGGNNNMVVRNNKSYIEDIPMSEI